jgi:N-acetyl-gamma-glutamyl-phosphate/LysW-gamma-L-alpha-aminoadipyl-6-phosphate reductase
MKIAIVGGAGYTGGELVRLLLQHPEVEIEAVTSSTFSDEFLYTIHPNLRSFTTLKFTPFNPDNIVKNCEQIFLATPHGASKDFMPSLLESGIKVTDLSADFRLKNPADYPKWYGWEHPAPGLLSEAVYGLPELHRAQIKNAKLVACAGCMAGTSILALAPLLRSGLIDPTNIIIDAKIGSTGGGSRPTPANHHSERFGSVHPYQVTGHRHIAEIEQELSAIAKNEVKIGFTPHGVNMARGILITSHNRLVRNVSEREIWKAYRESYNDEPFIRFVKSKKGLHQLPDPKNVIGTNFCDIGFELDEHINRLVVLASIDNIVKGAAGQAVQCFNIMNGFPEKTALNLIGYH